MTYNEKKPAYVYLYLVLAAMLIYVVQDIMSQQVVVGFDQTDRSGARYAQIVITIVLFLYFFFSFLRRPVLSRAMTVLLLILLWCIVVDLIQRSFDWTVFMRLGVSALWFLVFYFFSNYLRRHPGALRHLGFGIALMFVLYAVASLYASSSIQLARSRFGVHNLVYFTIVFTPWLFLAGKRWIRSVGLAVVIVVTVFSMKRGAIVALPLMIGCSLMVEAKILGKVVSYFFKIVFATAVFMAAVYAANLYSEGFLAQRFTHELVEGSDRSRLYALTWDAVGERNVFDFVLGTGSGSSMDFLSVGGSAHNEWLEFLFSYGFVGAVLYALFLLVLLIKMLRLLKSGSALSVVLCCAVVYFLVVGMYSIIYHAHTTLFLMALLGTIEGLEVKGYTVEKSGTLLTERQE